MKILQLCKKFPYPLNDGESLAVTYLAKGLQSCGAEVTLLSMNTKRHYFNMADLPDTYNHYKDIHVSYLDNTINLWDASMSLLTTNESYHISRFICPAFEKKLIDLLKKNSYDVILLETVILAPYLHIIRAYSDAIVAMHAHNVEHQIWQRISDNKRFLPTRWVYSKFAERLRNFELSVMNDFDLFVPISSSDLLKFRACGLKATAHVCPIGLDTDDYVPNDKSFEKPPSISFIGSLDWMPNVEGLLWFLDEVWPALRQKYPKLTFHVAGKSTPPHLMNRQDKGVIFHGEVPSSIDFINKHSIMVVPLFSGSGIRAKIIEGVLLGKAVVTTTIGLEGISATPNEEVLVADTKTTFINQLSKGISGKTCLPTLGHKARLFGLKHFSNKEIAHNLIEQLVHQIKHEKQALAV